MKNEIQLYPRIVYHPEKEEVTVRNAEEYHDLISTGWGDTPFRKSSFQTKLASNVSVDKSPSNAVQIEVHQKEISKLKDEHKSEVDELKDALELKGHQYAAMDEEYNELLKKHEDLVKSLATK